MLGWNFIQNSKARYVHRQRQQHAEIAGSLTTPGPHHSEQPASTSPAGFLMLRAPHQG